MNTTSHRSVDAPAPPQPPVKLRVGQCVAVDFHGCHRARLADKAAVEQALLRAARDSGATVVAAHFHVFAPQGVSGVVVITESHFAIHTWPELGFAAVDLFTCGPSVDFERAIGVLHEELAATTPAVVQRLERGTLPELRVDASGAASPTVATWREKFERERISNIVAVIDLYGARAADAGITALLASASARLGGASGSDMVSWGPGRTHFAATSDTHSIAGRISVNGARVYLTVMSATFFDPRALAEEALRLVHGSHYGMQVEMQP